MKRCLLCHRTVGGFGAPPWTMTTTGQSRRAVHLDCARVLRETVASSGPALTAAGANTPDQARLVRRIVAVVRTKVRLPR